MSAGINAEDRLWLDQVWQQLALQIEAGGLHEFIHGAIVGRRFDRAAAHKVFARLSGDDGLSAFRLLCAALCELQLRQGHRLSQPAARSVRACPRDSEPFSQELSCDDP